MLKRQYEYLIFSLSQPILNPHWNILLDYGLNQGHRTMAELCSLGYVVKHILQDKGKYIYYFEREYDENDGLNRSLPANYNHRLNK